MSNVHHLERGYILWIRNLLLSFGAFWLSLWVVVPLAWVFAKLNAGIIYGDSVLSAIAMGVMTSMGRAMAAALAGVVVTLLARSPEPVRWALIIATLCVIDAPRSQHWFLPPTAWDRLWWSVDLLFPAIATIAAAVFVNYLRHKGDHAASGAKSSPLLRILHYDRIEEWIAKQGAGLCVATAFLPLVVTIVGINADMDISSVWGVFFNPINLAAYLWLCITIVHYRRTRTRGAAWIFALFPIAFAEPALIISLWISTRYPPK